MRKILIVFLMISLISISIHANPKPGNTVNEDFVIGVISVITLGLGYLFYKTFSNKDKVEFINEEVNISINNEDEVNVEGIYRFKRTGKSVRTFEILYPFPEQKQFGEIEIDFIAVNGREMKYHQFELKRYDRISLSLDFNEIDECELVISFKQKPLKFSYKYILKTTKKWKKELEESIINISLPVSKDFQSNYMDFMRKENPNEKKTEFIMHKINFYSDEDLMITWSEG